MKLKNLHEKRCTGAGSEAAGYLAEYLRENLSSEYIVHVEHRDFSGMIAVRSRTSAANYNAVARIVLFDDGDVDMLCGFHIDKLHYPEIGVHAERTNFHEPGSFEIVEQFVRDFFEELKPEKETSANET